MTQVALSPVFNDTQFSDNNGLPLAGGKIFTYQAGSNSVQQATYTSFNADVEQSNPIVLDSSGRLPNEMWLVDGFAYNMVLTLADGTTVLQSIDNVRGSMPVPPGGGLDTVIWNSTADIPEYVSANQFSVLGDYTTQFRVGNRVRYQFSDLSYGFATVTNVIFDGTNTQVTLELDSTGFNNTVINVAWSALVAINMTVDAAGVSFSQVMGYGGNNVGTELQSLRTLAGSNNTVWPATGGGGSAFAANPVVASTTYEGGRWMVKFDAAITSGVSTISISGLGGIPLKQYDNTGALIDAVFAANMITEIAYDTLNASMIVLDQLPYTPPPPTPPSFAPTTGSAASNVTFTVTAGPSGKIALTVSCFAHANFADFGEGTFKLYDGATVINSQAVRFFEWDGRTGGCGATLVGVTSPGAGLTTTFKVIYSGPGSPYTSNWMAITA